MDSWSLGSVNGHRKCQGPARVATRRRWRDRAEVCTLDRRLNATACVVRGRGSEVEPPTSRSSRITRADSARSRLTALGPGRPAETKPPLPHPPTPRLPQHMKHRRFVRRFHDPQRPLPACDHPAQTPPRQPRQLDRVPGQFARTVARTIGEHLQRIPAEGRHEQPSPSSGYRRPGGMFVANELEGVRIGPPLPQSVRDRSLREWTRCRGLSCRAALPTP